MIPRDVVTSFLEDPQGRFLLLRRSGAVRTYQNWWGGVSGSIEPGATPLEQARREIEEETGLEASLRREAPPFVLIDPEAGAFRVFPFLFRVERPEALRLDRENQEARWVEALPAGEPLVPALGESLRLARGGAPLRLPLELRRSLLIWMGDRERGASALATQIAALLVEVLRLEPALSPADRLLSARGFARLAIEAHPSMAVVARALAEVLGALEEGGAEAAVLAANRFTQRLREAQQAAVENAVRLLGAGRWVTLSRSAAVEGALLARRGPARVLESRPLGEGRALAERLRAAGIEVALYPDAAMALALDGCAAAVIGADALLEGGAVVNKIGSRPFALLAAAAKVPCYVIAESLKLSLTPLPTSQEGEPQPEASWKGPAIPGEEAIPEASAGVGAEIPLFEVVPAELLAGVVSEHGLGRGAFADPEHERLQAQLGGPYLQWEE